MRLTKDAQKVWDKFKAEDLTDDEIFERVPIWPHEYESEEERKFEEQETARLINEHRAKEKANRTVEEQEEINEFVKKLINGK